MITCILTDKISKNISKKYNNSFFTSNRRLCDREISLIRQFSFKKLYLPSLSAPEIQEFYREFDKFWDELIVDFGHDHVFWRNAVSSKMQEWDKSIGYLTLVLWTLKNISKKSDFRLVIVCESFEEIQVFSQWCLQEGFIIVKAISPARLWFKRVAQECWNFVRFFYIVYVCCKKKNAAPRIGGGKMREDLGETLIVSEFYSYSIRGGDYRDPCFGQLHQIFLEQNHKFIILADLIDAPLRSTRDDLRLCQSVNLFYIYSLLGWFTIIRVLFRLLIHRLHITRPCSFYGCDLSALVRWHLRRFNYAFNVNAELFFEAVKELGRRYRFRRMLLIFEDNVLERACIQAFRILNKQAIIEGYSHGVIYPLNLKLHLTDQERDKKPQCDRYLTCGNHASQLLSRIGNRPPEKIVSACALRSIPVFEPEELEHDSKNTVLVALDGACNADQQFDWLVENKDVFQDHHVVLRAHPNVPWDYIRKRSIYIIPKEFEISQKNLKEDFARSFCVIYRIASIGLQAILNGIPSIHMQIDLPLEGDPICGLNRLKWVVRNPAELREALMQIKNISVEEMNKARTQARRFAEEYFGPATRDRIGHFLGIERAGIVGHQ